MDSEAERDEAIAKLFQLQEARRATSRELEKAYDVADERTAERDRLREALEREKREFKNALSALDNLSAAIQAVDREGEAADIEELDTAHAEANELLEARSALNTGTDDG